MVQLGTSFAMGLKNMAIKKNRPQNTEVRPVRPPAAAPALTSLNVVMVEVPHRAPTVVAMASESMPAFMFRGSPFSSIRPARSQAAYKVPRVSNISTIQKDSAVVAMVRSRLALP